MKAAARARNHRRSVGMPCFSRSAIHPTQCDISPRRVLIPLNPPSPTFISALNFSGSLEAADERVAAGELERDEVRQELESEKAKNSDGRKAELTAKVAEKEVLLAKVKIMREKASEIEGVTREVQRVSDLKAISPSSKLYVQGGPSARNHGLE